MILNIYKNIYDIEYMEMFKVISGSPESSKVIKNHFVVLKPMVITVIFLGVHRFRTPPHIIYDRVVLNKLSDSV